MKPDVRTQLQPAVAVNRRRRRGIQVSLLLLVAIGVGFGIYLCFDDEKTVVANDDLQLEQKLDAIQNQGHSNIWIFKILPVGAGLLLALAVIFMVRRRKSRGLKKGGRRR